ncbi:hypothetical protein B2J96_03310 [Mycobacterium shigaense]|nr:hypothetical protein B2J96_03310 [Mycobacterium shigaense]
MDFSAAEQPTDGSDASAALDFSPAEPDETPDILAAIDSLTHTAEEDVTEVVPLFTVTNPPGTVSVSALRDGGIDRVALSGTVTRMTESQLAEEILVIASLAGQQGQAAQHEFLWENMRELGADDPDALHDLLENGMALASPEQAAETRAHVFATRYATG